MARTKYGMADTSRECAYRVWHSGYSEKTDRCQYRYWHVADAYKQMSVPGMPERICRTSRRG
eukprot:1465105-Rhodomonas_salina.5